MQRRSDSRFAALIRRLVVLAAAVAVVIVLLALVRAGAAPTIAMRASSAAIGRKTNVTIDVAEPGRGISNVSAELVQGGKTTPLGEISFPVRPFWAFWGHRTQTAQMNVAVGRDAVPSLTAGEAVVRVNAARASTWLRHPATVVAELKLPVRLAPPAVQLVSSKHYVAQGGCEAVVYKIGEAAVRDGVRVGDWFFPGHALPGGGKQDRFALFAVPYDRTDSSAVKLVAADDAGNESAVTFIDQFFPRPMKADTIELNDAFLGKVVPEIMAQTAGFADRGGPLPNYLAINGELRRANAAELKKLAEASQEKFLWKEAFAPFPGGQVMSNFADHRTYVYNGQKVDQQDHLGFDLASTEKANVPAANTGVVVLARYFGIYGNTVVLDHGYGLLSLYAHLSSIDVKDGQPVERGTVLGRSGQTGLAGGDHLHFTMLLDGLAVTPVEWWDPHWLQDRLAGKLGAALPYKQQVAAARPARRR
jgi:murein DD-endopeptidase MepM/ murein hydrolase activator NlpD